MLSARNMMHKVFKSFFAYNKKKFTPYRGLGQHRRNFVS